MPLGMWSNMNDFLGFVPQHVSPNFVGENGDFYNKLVRHDATVVSAYPTHHNLDEVEFIPSYLFHCAYARNTILDLIFFV